ncbi:MAG: hypothetical protein KDD33_06740 [Bdellovibrionales bacterium]|nr:hypothetical protein [Bdellovibrionales bacterium]
MEQTLKTWVEFKDLQTQEDSIIAQFRVNKEMPFFQGHFPNNPVLPAVTMVDISVFLLQQKWQPISWEKLIVKKSKFMSLIRPDQVVKIQAIALDGQSWQVQWMSPDSNDKLAVIQIEMTQ